MRHLKPNDSHVNNFFLLGPISDHHQISPRDISAL